jgi:acetyltransferase-like isoleucine patch superfamily enzyme
MSRWLSILYAIVSLLGQLLVGLLIGLALVPSVLFVRWVWVQLPGDTFFDVLLLCLAVGLGFVIFGNALLLVIILVRNVFRIRNRERRGKVFSVESIGNALYNLLLHVASLYYLPVLKSTYFNLWFYRAMGAKIGKGTLIATHRLWDVDLIEIGEDCLIGGNSSIAAHYAQGSRGRLRRVRIGNRVTIGANTSVMPGVVIEDDVTVGSNSLVPLGVHLKSGGIYLGVPVQRVN